MRRYIAFVVRHPVAVLTAVLLVTAFLATQIRHVHLEIRRRAALPQHHRFVEIQNRIADLFGGEAVVVIGLIATSGDIYTPAMLGKVRRITQRLQKTPGIIETSLFSLAGPYVKAVLPGADDTMEVRPLLTEGAIDSASVADLRRNVDSDRLFHGNLVSEDGTATVILAEFDDRLTDIAIADRIEAIVAPERDDTVIVALAGAPILRYWLTQYTRMIAVLFPVAVLVIGLIHYEAFRTVQAMLLPLVTALLSVFWALGIMGLSGEPMDTWSAITPVVILAVAAGHAVQILKRFYEEFARLGDVREAVVASIVAVGPVMLTAGLVAVAGFSSLLTFDVTSVRVFGLLLASGIGSALLIEMTFTPACRCLLPAPKLREMQREREGHWLGRALDAIAGVVTARPRAVLTVAALVTIVAGLGALRLHVDNSFRLWFSPATQVRKDDALLNDKLQGTASLRLLIEGARDGVLTEPAVLHALSDLEAFLEDEPEVGGVMSIAGHVKRMHKAMNRGDAAAYAIPDNARLISQYLLLYDMAAGPDGLSAVVDPAQRNAVVRALSKTDSAAFSAAFIERVQGYVDRRFEGLPVEVGVAGGTLGVQTAMNEVVIREKLANMVQVGLIIFVLSTVALRSPIGGLLVLTPLCIATIVTLGAMGWSGTWLDMTTAAFTAMGVSIGADFVIYLLFRIREELRGGTVDLPAAIATSLQTSGKAIFFVSSAVVLGYLVLPFSGFSLWIRLGVLTALIIGTSALATLAVIPALTVVGRPRFLLTANPQEPPAEEPEHLAVGGLRRELTEAPHVQVDIVEA